MIILNKIKGHARLAILFSSLQGSLCGSAVPNANTSRAALLIEEGKPPAAKTSVLVNSSLEKKSPEPAKTEKESLPQPITQPDSFKIAKLTDNLIAYQNRE